MILANNDFEHLEQIKEIADLTLGEGYADPDSIINAQVSIHAAIDDKVVGYATGFIDYPSVLGVEQKTLQLLYPFKTGIIGNVATHPDFQRRGIGYALTQEIIKRLQFLHQNTIVGSAWKSKNGINIGKVFDKLGFKQVVEIPAFWKGCPCIQCDAENKKCDCPAVIYELSLK